MQGSVELIRDLLDRVRSRWRRLIVLQAAGRGALAVSAVLVALWLLSHWALAVPVAAAALGLMALAAVAGAVAWALWPAREVPSDTRVARFIEESQPELDDRLASAVDVAAGRADASSLLAAPMLADAARAASTVDPGAVVPASRLRRASLQAVAAALLLAVVAFGTRDAVRGAVDALSFALFSSPVKVEARVPVGSPPRVTRIDLEYVFPAALHLAPRAEQNSGDIYAPSGTEVHLRIHTDPEASAGRMALADGKTIALRTEGGDLLTGALTVVEDNSYRIALSGRDGLASPGDTEYFIRTLDDRPPEVHIMKPARDRAATPLEEVDIEARAVDDFGVESLDLVYAVNGGREKAARLDIPRQASSATGRYTLPLEDLGVRPGDFITYYARARDLARGKPSSEARSDMFFLEVKPFVQGAARAGDESDGGGSSDPQIDDLVAAQKDVIVATWKLDRRTQESGGAQSEDDVRSVSRAEAALKSRVERTASSFRESQMRDPRQRLGSTPPAAGQTTASEDEMAAAASAMGKAVASLNELKTSPALPSEMEALNHLLKARGDAQQRQAAATQNASGNGANNSNVDLSSRFDKELQRQQRTNYETRTNENEREGDTDLDKIKDLARRQDELNQRQQDLGRAKNRMTAEELKRQLETLTREQSDLRQRTEELAREMAEQQDGGDSSPSTGGRQAASGQQPSGSPSSSGGRQGRSGGQQAQSGKPEGQPDPNQQMREVSDAMRQAASDLRQQEPERAAERGAEAVDQLRELERQLEARGPAEAPGKPGNNDEETKRLAEERARAEALRERIEALTSQLSASSDKAQAGAKPSGDLSQLEQEYARLLAQARELVEQVRREDPSMAQGGTGFTFEGQGTTLSAPGTEAFKQDVARWQQLSRQATQALDRAVAAIARRQLARDSRDRLASGADDKPPASYESQVDSYFKALATKKQP